MKSSFDNTNETSLKESNRSNYSSVEELIIKKSQSDIENQGVGTDSESDVDQDLEFYDKIKLYKQVK